MPNAIAKMIPKYKERSVSEGIMVEIERMINTKKLSLIIRFFRCKVIVKQGN